MKFELAPQDKIAQLSKEIDMLLHYIGFEGALVTDESMLSDFCFDEVEDNQTISDILDEDIKLTRHLYLWEAVLKIKEKIPNWPNNS